MITQMNKVELVGCVGSVSSHPSGEKTCTRFSLATNAVFRTESGESVIETTWHNVVTWADIQVKAGDALRVVGRLKCTRYTAADGAERRSVEVVATEVARCKEKPIYETI